MTTATVNVSLSFHFLRYSLHGWVDLVSLGKERIEGGRRYAKSSEMSLSVVEDAMTFLTIVLVLIFQDLGMSRYVCWVMEDQGAQVGTAVTPSPNDVILGRGETRSPYCYKGNIWFRMILKQSLPQFSNCRNRLERVRVMNYVFDSILNRGGRFLHRDCSSGFVVVASPERVKKAIYQAFRYLGEKKNKSTSKKKKCVKNDVGLLSGSKAQTEPSPAVELFTDEELSSVLPFQRMRSKTKSTVKKETCENHVGSLSTFKFQAESKEEDLFTDEELVSVLPGVECIANWKIINCPHTMQSSTWILTCDWDR